MSRGPPAPRRETPTSAAFDAVVIGGGPAGAAIARLLALRGHSVLVLTRAADAARGAAESLLPSTRKLLAKIGMLESIDGAGFYRTTGNTVWWGKREGHVEQFDASGEASGYQVYRPQFDRVLLAGAADAGAEVICDAHVRRVQLDGDAGALVEYQCPLIHDREIVLGEALSLPEAPEGVRFIAGVDLLKLGEMACRHHQVPDLFEDYCRTYGAVPLPSLLGSLSVLLARGVLEER